eukprot:10345963-Alexandrium_andersonii.AAC.1
MAHQKIPRPSRPRQGVVRLAARPEATAPRSTHHVSVQRGPPCKHAAAGTAAGVRALGSSPARTTTVAIARTT